MTERTKLICRYIALGLFLFNMIMAIVTSNFCSFCGWGSAFVLGLVHLYD